MLQWVLARGHRPSLPYYIIRYGKQHVQGGVKRVCGRGGERLTFLERYSLRNICYAEEAGAQGGSCPGRSSGASSYEEYWGQDTGGQDAMASVQKMGRLLPGEERGCSPSVSSAAWRADGLFT